VSLIDSVVVGAVAGPPGGPRRLVVVVVSVKITKSRGKWRGLGPGGSCCFTACKLPSLHFVCGFYFFECIGSLFTY